MGKKCLAGVDGRFPRAAKKRAKKRPPMHTFETWYLMICESADDYDAPCLESGEEKAVTLDEFLEVLRKHHATA